MMSEDRKAEGWVLPDHALFAEQRMELLLREGLLSEAEQRASRLSETALPPEVERLREQSMVRVRRRIRKKLFQSGGARRFGHGARRLAQVAVACISILSIGIASALAVSDTARQQVLHYLVEIGDVSTELSMEAADVTLDVPEGYEGKYFPGYIPEGFELVQVYRDYVQYRKADGDLYFTYHEYSPDARVSIDTEGAEISYMECFGVRVMISEKNGNVMCNWAFDDGFYLLDFDGSKEEAIRILKSLTKKLQ